VISRVVVNDQLLTLGLVHNRGGERTLMFATTIAFVVHSSRQREFIAIDESVGIHHEAALVLHSIQSSTRYWQVNHLDFPRAPCIGAVKQFQGAKARRRHDEQKCVIGQRRSWKLFC
jgi:hypothetical protein